MAGEGSQSPSTSARSELTFTTWSGSVSSKYSNGETQNASSPSARALTCPATRLSQPLRARMRRAAAMRNRMSSTSTDGLLVLGRDPGGDGGAGSTDHVEVDVVQPRDVREGERVDDVVGEPADGLAVALDRRSRIGPRRRVV